MWARRTFLSRSIMALWQTLWRMIYNNQFYSHDNLVWLSIPLDSTVLSIQAKMPEPLIRSSSYSWCATAKTDLSLVLQSFDAFNEQSILSYQVQSILSAETPFWKSEHSKKCCINSSREVRAFMAQTLNPIYLKSTTVRDRNNKNVSLLLPSLWII